MKKLLTIFIFITLFLSAFIIAGNVLADTCKKESETAGSGKGVCVTGTTCPSLTATVSAVNITDCTNLQSCCEPRPCDKSGESCAATCGVAGSSNSDCILTMPSTKGKCCLPPATGGCPSGATCSLPANCPLAQVDASGKCSTGTPPQEGVCCKPATGGASNVRIPTAGKSQASEAVELSRLKALGFSGTIPGLIGNIVKSILSFVGAFALLMVVYGGLLLLISQGNPEGVGKGKKIITWAIIGVAVILGSYVLVDFVIKGIGGEGGGGTEPGGATPTQGDIPNCVTDLGGTCKPACATGEENLNPTSDCKQICCYLPSASTTCDLPNKCMTGAECLNAGATDYEKRNCVENTLCCILQAAPPKGQVGSTPISGDACFTSTTTCYCPATREGWTCECTDRPYSQCLSRAWGGNGTIDGFPPSSNNLGGVVCKSICIRPIGSGNPNP